MIYNLNMGIYDYVIKVCRALHEMPEGSDRGAVIYDELKRMKYRPKRTNAYVAADIRGEKSRRKVALRAFIPDEAESASMLLYIAGRLKEVKPSVDVRIIFDRGAENAVESGAAKGVSEIYALRLCRGLEAGKVASCDGVMSAGKVEFSVEFSGVRAKEAADEFTLSAGSVNGDCLNNARLSIEVQNSAVKCTLRYFDYFYVDKLMMRLEKILVDCDNSLSTEHRLVVTAVTPPLVNNPAMLSRLKTIAKVEECEPSFEADDFAFYLEKVRGCACLLSYSGELNESVTESGVKIYEKLIYEK